MTLIEETFRDMQRNSISYMRTNEGLWIAQPAIKAKVLLLEKNFKDLDNSIAAQKGNKKSGYVDQKNNLTENMITRFYALGCKLSFYAREKNDRILLSDVKFSVSSLEGMTEEELAGTFALILKRGREYLPKLTDYSVTAEELDDLEEDLEILKKMPVTVDQTSNQHKSATRTIKSVNKVGREILNMLDDAFDGILAGNIEFLEGWYEVRKIKGRPKIIRKKKNGNGTDTSGANK